VRLQFRAPAAVTLAVMVVSVSANAAPAKPVSAITGELEAARQDGIAAARDAQQHEQAVTALEHTIELLRRDAEGRQRDLDESRAEQARLLGMLEYLARDVPERPVNGRPAAIGRIRGEMLFEGALPGLRAEAHALAGEVERVAALRKQIADKENELAGARQVHEADRAHLAELTARRLDLARRALSEDSGAAARIAKLGREASDIADLIKRADGAAEGRSKEVLARARAALPAEKAKTLTADAADPTRPHQLRAFNPPHTPLTMPVSGAVAQRFGAADAAPGSLASQGISVAAPPGAVAVAPFDGRIIYAGSFRNFGLVLIIRHGGLYHSLLAGLDRIDVKTDQWVLAGEPLGAMSEGSGGALYFELRRDDRPVDPQPWLAPGAAGRNQPDGDQ
jgi:septal ring factor EnvC (AmiA/AmiB activator)